MKEEYEEFRKRLLQSSFERRKTMIVNIIMFFTMYPVLLVLYFCFRGQYQYADGCLFAVNMKPEWIKEPEVAAIVEKFRREMKQYFLFFC